MMKDVLAKYKIWIICVVIYMFIIARVSSRPVALIAVSLIAIGLIIPIVIWIKVLVVHKLERVSKILREKLAQKEQLMRSMLRLLQTPIEYGRVQKPLQELEPVYFMGPGKPRRAIETLAQHADRIKDINKTLTEEVQNLVAADGRERKRIAYLLFHNVANYDEQLALTILETNAAQNELITEDEKRIIEKINNLGKAIAQNKEELQRSLEAENEDEAVILTLAEALSKKKRNTAEFVGQVQNALSETKTKKSPKGEIATALNELMKRIQSGVDSLKKEKGEIEKMITAAFNKRDEVNVLLAALETLPTTKEKTELLISTSSPLIVQTQTTGTEANVANIVQLIMLLHDKNVNPAWFAADQKERVASFIERRQNGKQLAKKVRAAITREGKEGLEQLLNILTIYFKVDFNTISKYTYTI
jgi:hypothetical protein